ncbi:MAG: S9 family peptidase, partial [Bacteroidales bacterium]|nr:S9 family peptidase [Bacteroidales bacterium]
MKKIVWGLMLALMTTTFCVAAELDLRDITNNVYRGRGTDEITPTKDGKHYIAANEDFTKLEKWEYASGKVVATLFDVATARECNIKSFEGYAISDDETRLLIYTNSEPIYRHSFKADYYTFEIKRNLLKPLSKNGKQQAAVYSPNGRMVAFVRDNNIFVKKLDFDTEIAVTTDGEINKVINGVPDWVYEEEFGFSSAMQWSSDSELLSFIRFNESKVKEFAFTLYGSYSPDYPEYDTYTGEMRYKYPVSGEVNSGVQVMTYTVETRALKAHNVPLDSDGYIPRIFALPEADQLAVVTLNRHQNHLSLYKLNARSGVSRLLLEDEDPTWIDQSVLDMMHFYPDFFVFASDRDGWMRLYQYNNNGIVQRAISPEKEDVTAYLGYNAEKGIFYCQATAGAINRAIYSYNKKAGITNLTPEAGTHSAIFNPSCTYYIHGYSSATVPPVYTLRNAAGKAIRTIEDNAKVAEAVAQTNMPAREFFTMDNGAGYMLNGFMVKPYDFDASKQYPAVLVQYSGPGSQEVLNNWEIDWYHYLANQGFVVICVDGRGTGGRGKAFESVVYQNLGYYETQDQLAAARYAASLPYVDGNNIGIWGWSFGGYEVLMALTTGNGTFKAGVYIAPVTDWRYYDSIYTERYMRTPNENHDGYRNSSPITHAEKLQGSLLIVSG